MDIVRLFCLSQDYRDLARTDMIITFFLQISDLFLTGVVNALPSSTGLPSGISDALNYAVIQISQWSFIFPIQTVLTILSYTILIEVTLWLFHGGTWVYDKVRGI